MLRKILSSIVFCVMQPVFLFSMYNEKAHTTFRKSSLHKSSIDLHVIQGFFKEIKKDPSMLDGLMPLLLLGKKDLFEMRLTAAARYFLLRQQIVLKNDHYVSMLLSPDKKMHKKINDIRNKNRGGFTDLEYACTHGYAKSVNKLLDAGALFTGEYKEYSSRHTGFMLLYNACVDGYVDVAKVLLDYGVKFYYLGKVLHWHENITRSGNSIWHAIALSKKPLEMLALIKKYLPQDSNLFNFQEFDWSISNNFKETPLLLASRIECRDGIRDAIALYLIKNKFVDCQAQDRDGSTALHSAALWNCPNIVQALLSHKNKDSLLAIQDNYGNTPFLMACSGGYLPIIQLILQHRSMFNKTLSSKWLRSKNKKGQTGLICLLKKPLLGDHLSLREHREVFALLLKEFPIDNSAIENNLNKRNAPLTILESYIDFYDREIKQNNTFDDDFKEDEKSESNKTFSGIKRAEKLAQGYLGHYRFLRAYLLKRYNFCYKYLLEEEFNLEHLKKIQDSYYHVATILRNNMIGDDENISLKESLGVL